MCGCVRVRTGCAVCASVCGVRGMCGACGACGACGVLCKHGGGRASFSLAKSGCCVQSCHSSAPKAHTSTAAAAAVVLGARRWRTTSGGAKHTGHLRGVGSPKGVQLSRLTRRQEVPSYSRNESGCSAQCARPRAWIASTTCSIASKTACHIWSQPLLPRVTASIIYVVYSFEDGRVRVCGMVRLCVRHG